MNKLTLPNFDGITRIVCLDIGDGECSAFTCIIEDGIMAKKTEQLYFKIGKNDSEKTMPSVISYKKNSETGKLELVSIGNLQASKGNENYVSVANFKRNPINNENDKQEINWTGKHKAFKSYKKIEKTYKECMRDFIGCLWENLKENNSNDAEILPRNPKNEETMIFAACPSSRVWTDHRDQYAKLISDATGIGQKNIHIFRESDVAAYRKLKNADESLTLDHGVVVIDCGSSTLDFTYMEKGEIKEAFSWTLGAGMIERLMFEKMKTILEKSDKPNERELLKYLETGKNSDYYLFSIRKDAKEDYFSPEEEGKKTNETVEYYLEDANKEFGKKFYIDDTFMNDVLSMPIGSEVMCDGKHALSESSWEFGWEQCFKAFLKTCEAKLDGSQIDRIVLTGGASRMYFIEELCKKVFAGIYVEKDDHPYSCVSYGLSRLAFNMFHVENLIRKELSEIENDDFEDLDYACRRIETKIGSYLIKKRDEAIADLKKKENIDPKAYYRSWELRDCLNKLINESVSTKSIESAITNEVQEFRNVLTQRYQKASERCSKALYDRESVGGEWESDPYSKSRIYGVYKNEDVQIFPDNCCFSLSLHSRINSRLGFFEKLNRKSILKATLKALEIGNQSSMAEALYRVGKLSDFQVDSDVTTHTLRILKAINIPTWSYTYPSKFKAKNEGFLADVYFERIKEIIMRVALLTDYACDINFVSKKPSLDSSNDSYEGYSEMPGYDYNWSFH